MQVWLRDPLLSLSALLFSVSLVTGNSYVWPLIIARPYRSDRWMILIAVVTVVSIVQYLINWSPALYWLIRILLLKYTRNTLPAGHVSLQRTYKHFIKTYVWPWSLLVCSIWIRQWIKWSTKTGGRLKRSAISSVYGYLWHVLSTKTMHPFVV